MAATVGLWDPPEGMGAAAVKAWRAFYAKAMDAYGITPADYRLLYVAQKGRCWICQTAKGLHPDDPKARGGRRLGIDHDHTTGQVRGLLCGGSLSANTCNRVIARYNAPTLARAHAYLVSRWAQPAWVLEKVRKQAADAEREGAVLSQEEMDALAVSYLWPDHVPA